MREVKAFVGALICAVTFQLTAEAFDHEHNRGYISWGVDEFEFFGLTKSELSQKFKAKLAFDKDYSHAGFNASCLECRGFVLTFKNNRVTEVQRQLRDGAGCNLLGYVFSTKEAALHWTIDGLAKLSPLTADEKARLAVAKKSLLEIERGKTLKERSA